MIPLFKPYVAEELPLLDHILHSGQLAYGQFSREFENKLAQYVDIDKVICANSFNSAYLIAIKALGLKPGDEVIASPMCCLASSQPLAMSGLKVVWADVDPKTGTLNPESVKAKITSNTKAIFHNHFCGYIGYVEDLRHIASENGLLLIDDVSEAFGSEYKGKKAGNWGADATIYSFQTVRLPNAVDGGAVSFKNEFHTEQATLLRDYGIDRPRFRDDIGEIWSGCDIEIAAYGALPNDVNSYIGTLALDRTDELIVRQRENAAFWSDTLPTNLAEPIKPLDDTNPNYWIFGILVKDKRKFIEFMRQNGQYYASSVHLPNSYYSLFGSQAEHPGVTEFHNHFVALPCGWWMRKGVMIEK